MKPTNDLAITQYQDGPAMFTHLARKIALMVPQVRRLEEERNAALRRINALERQISDIAQRQERPAEPAQAQPEHVMQQAVEQALSRVRAEYTSLPRFGYHLPLDYEALTLPPAFDPPVMVEGEKLPLPPVAERHGHAGSDADYLEWGRYEKDILLGFMREGLPSLDHLSIMDFGCSSGRILRHFYDDAADHGWALTGVDVSARRIEWMRRHWPRDIQVYTGTFLPHLPFESNSFDVIYGMSVFTHMKYLWDTWLLELRRVLKPGGMLIQSIHTEHAWRFFYDNNQQAWAQDALGPMILQHETMPSDFVYFGDLDKNQVFWKREIALEFWSRYFRDVRVLPPPERYSYQNWVIGRK
ncbi:MAG: class I SAM-dependent methyltransferase [Proteobacteria bacterium]|nr:class I SAM-dependent methyltransferase [Pseudomonadota bacterium]